MPTAHNGDVGIHYELDGPDDGEPVVLLEGLGYGRWMWRWQRERLNDEYRVVLPDNRGTGDSDVPEGPYSMADMAADLEAVLADVEAADGTAGLDAVHVVGASMGGMIAQQYAFDYDRAATLTLLCTSHGGEESVPIPEDTAQQILEVPEGYDERETIKHRMEPAVSDGFYEANPDLVESIVDWRLAGDATEAGRNAQAAAVQAFDVSDRVDEIELPVRLLHGDADRVVPVENGRMLDEKLPNAELVEVEDGPHLFFVEQPDLAGERTREHLEANPIETDAEGGAADADSSAAGGN
ncbi:putative hydrolase or acyltransferase of alpha/beta superfamily protein [Salinarchaeum sp. Harcht-Bsk1]|uniref:alpha/beta fold hydrolase n=1 Tax=Salinarchaeum sp. Harcht-Bsk1 TaxID=1333523 RepID=UPI0003424961|nr:alpha/beta hydrolase [Salinarchaeum sp. Harcht-Bsk1]AGN01280.1 putative hydrolase or acyltransferase of alpha/beta superfamily protein [Salinarchaeum sp. Harcht-Bsk1]